MARKWIAFLAVIVAAGVFGVGCEDDDSPIQPGDCTITVVNSTTSAIHVTYQTQTWDVVVPATDVSHRVSKDVAAGTDVDLSVHFDSQLGTSRIQVEKNGFKKNYDVGFNSERLTIRESDFP